MVSSLLMHWRYHSVISLSCCQPTGISWASQFVTSFLLVCVSHENCLLGGYRFWQIRATSLYGIWLHFHAPGRVDSRLAPSQWETLLQSNAVSHWLGTNLESAQPRHLFVAPYSPWNGTHWIFDDNVASFFFPFFQIIDAWSDWILVCPGWPIWDLPESSLKLGNLGGICLNYNSIIFLHLCYWKLIIVASGFNSLRPSDAIWRPRTGSTLAQVMACCLTAPSHYLNQCWRIISKVLWCSCEVYFTRYLSHQSPKLAWKLLL